METMRIDPPFWFCGMKESVLQLAVCARGIRQAEVSVAYPGARIVDIARLDSPNHLFVYIDTARTAPGVMRLSFSLGGHTVSVPYELRQRKPHGKEHAAITNADVIYLLMPDRFAQGRVGNAHIRGLHPYRIDRAQPGLRHGGDLEGIRRHMDYFVELGVTALWLTPVFENDSPDEGCNASYHGYAITDYYRVDPRLGSNDDYCNLVAEAHSKGLKVVADMVFNHCGICHPWIADLPAHDWLNHSEWLGNAGDATQATAYVQTNYRPVPTKDSYASDTDLRQTVEGWFVPSMPDLNQHNPHLMTYLTQCSKWWVETADVDGIRMDTYPYAFADAMSRWAKEMDEEYPWLYVVGETWVTETAFTAAWQRESRLSDADSHLKGVMDFAFFDRINKAKGEDTDDFQSGLNRIYNVLAYDFLYAAPENVLAFLDNHDTDRFLGTGHNADALRQALAILLTVKRIPQLYYGTEILLNGIKEESDGTVRCDFPGGFPGDRRDAFTQDGRTARQNAMFTWLSRLLHWRQGCEAIARGSMKHFIPFGGVYVIHRQYERCNVLTVLNGRNAAVSFCAARYAEVVPHGTVAREVTSNRRYDISRNFSLRTRQTLVLEYGGNTTSGKAKG